MKIRPTRAILAATLLSSAAFVTMPAHAVPTWNPSGSVRPGVQTNNPSGQCTANFVFYDSSNNIYIGQSAHCTTLGGPTDTNGCTTGSRALNTNVSVGGAQYPGKLVYNSWLTMQAAGETNSSRCRYNDFALVKLDTRDYGRVNPSVPFWGGPQGQYSPSSAVQEVYSYGNSGLRFGLQPLSPKTGYKTSQTGSDGGRFWSHQVYTASPGIPGDSGSAFLDSQGRALGTLSTLSADGSNGVTDIGLALDYMRSKVASLSSIQLANGLVTFNPIV